MKQKNFRKGFYKLEEWEDKKRECNNQKLGFSSSDFHGPSICVLITKQKGKLPVLELVEDTYDFGDVSISIGQEKLMEVVAEEYYKENGSFYLVTKFGRILINSENVRELIKEFKMTIKIF